MAAAWLTSADSDYESARMPWNVAADQRPAAVVMASTADDVAEAVRKARASGLRVAMQGTGHAASSRHTLDDAVLIKTGHLADVNVDPSARRARVGAGVQWQAVAEAAAPHGLAGLAGSSGGVGVVGYSLGGGLGWLARKHGLACSRIMAADVVLADGTQTRVDSDNEPDLLWALRGGGGCFAAVTSLEVELVPLTEVYGGTLFFPAERASEVLTAYSTWVSTVPDSVTSTGRLVNVPPIPDAPEALRGRSFVLVQAVVIAEEAEGVELLRPLRDLGPEMDTFAMLPAPALGMIHMDPPGPVPADIEGWLLNQFGPDEVAAMVANGGAGSPLVALQVRHLGGAMATPAPGGGAVDHIAQPFAAYGVGIVPEPAAATVVRGKLDEVAAAFGPALASRRFANLSEHCDPSSLFTPDAYARLQKIRSQYDPDGVFHAVHTVS